jgi:hypothetical protein
MTIGTKVFSNKELSDMSGDNLLNLYDEALYIIYSPLEGNPVRRENLHNIRQELRKRVSYKEVLN